MAWCAFLKHSYDLFHLCNKRHWLDIYKQHRCQKPWLTMCISAIVLLALDLLNTLSHQIKFCKKKYVKIYFDNIMGIKNLLQKEQILNFP